MKYSMESQLWKGALLPSSITGIIGIVIMGIIHGRPGVVGGILAEFIVLIFFAVHLIISVISNKLDPIMTMALAMVSYFAKLIVLGAFLLIVLNTVPEESLNRPSFGIVAFAITFAWLAGEVRAFLKLRLHLPLPGDSSHK